MQKDLELIFCNAIKPDPLIDLKDWSNTFRMLPRTSSVEAGAYRTSRMPYTEEILYALSPTTQTAEVVWMKPTQIGATEIGNNLILCCAHIFPRACLMALPTEALAKKHSKNKFSKSMEDMPCLDNVFVEAKGRNSGNTILHKEFPGGFIIFCGANGTSARSLSIQVLILDDFDGFINEFVGEGDPSEAFRGRLSGGGDRTKLYINSTPTATDVGIHREYLRSSQGRYHVPCVKCGQKQEMVWGGKTEKHGIKFERDKNGDVKDAWYQCIFCGAKWHEHHKVKLLAVESGAQWIHTIPDRKVRGFQISSLYSPVGLYSWHQCVNRWLGAYKDPLKRRAFVNLVLGLPYEESGNQPNWEVVKRTAELYNPMTIPDGGRFLTMGTDTHDNRLVVVIRAWGAAEESWLVWYGELFGDPAKSGVWEQHDNILNKKFRHAGGYDLQIISCGIDSGGHRTQDVYNYCRKRGPVVFALAGTPASGKPVLGPPNAKDLTYFGKKIKGGVQLWPIGTDTAKTTFYSRINLESGEKKIHFYDASDQYFQGITAEKLVESVDKNGFVSRKWMQTRSNNHPLDCEVYAYAAALKVGLSFIDFKRPHKTHAPQAGAQSTNSTPPRQKQRARTNRERLW